MKTVIIRREDVDSINLNEAAHLIELLSGEYIKTNNYNIQIDLDLVMPVKSDKAEDIINVLLEHCLTTQLLDVYYHPQDGMFEYARCKNMRVMEYSMSDDCEKQWFSFRLQSPNYDVHQIQWKKVKQDV